MSGATVGPPSGTEAHRLKPNAISFLSNVVIGVASTAPAYSLAAALGAIVVFAQSRVPAMMLAAFVPMLFVAAAYYHLNRVDPDCGTTFSWVTRAMGPHGGWMGGWAIIATDILVMPGLAQIAGQYSFHLFNIPDPTSFEVAIVGALWIVGMTAICYVGIELSARLQFFLLAAEIVILAIFAVVALTKVYTGAAPEGSQFVSLTWFNPFAVDHFSDFTQAMLIAVFIYWGWDCGASVNEETENPGTAPARAAIVSTFLLLGLYVLVSVAAIAFAGPDKLANSSDFFGPIATSVLGNVPGKLLILAVLTSASASTQTTILPTARTMISMARARAVPRRFAAVHPRFLTPGFATLVMGAVSVIWYVGLTFLSSDTVLQDSVTATAFGIAFYYGLTGFACIIYYRRVLRNSIKNFIFMGVMPGLGGLIMFALFAKACFDFSDPAGHAAVFGVGAPLVFGVGSLLLGFVLMLVARFCFPDFFRREREVLDPSKLGAPAKV
jgi:amino acid transporter